MIAEVLCGFRRGRGCTDQIFIVRQICEKYMEISLKLESMPTLCKSAFLPADTTITRRVATTIEVASSVVHRKEYCFRGIKNNNIFPGPPATDQRAFIDTLESHLLPMSWHWCPEVLTST